MALDAYASGILNDTPARYQNDPLRQSLNGSARTMHEEDVAEKIPAVVPGCTFLDLMRAGKLPDPYYRENEGMTSWVANRNWVYERTFAVSDSLRNAPHVELVCEGLDTIATLWLNGAKIGSAKHLLKPESNFLRIQFDALTPYLKQRAWAAGKWNGIFHTWPEPAYVRKLARCDMVPG